MNSFYSKTRLPGAFFRKLANASVWDFRSQEPTARPKSASKTTEHPVLQEKFLEAQPFDTEGSDAEKRKWGGGGNSLFGASLLVTVRGLTIKLLTASGNPLNSLSLGFFMTEVVKIMFKMS